MKIWIIRILNILGIRKDVLICIRQDNTYVWTNRLGEKTSGNCCKCNELIFFEKQNQFYHTKICHICAGY